MLTAAKAPPALVTGAASLTDYDSVPTSPDRAYFSTTTPAVSAAAITEVAIDLNAAIASPITFFTWYNTGASFAIRSVFTVAAPSGTGVKTFAVALSAQPGDCLGAWCSSTWSPRYRSGISRWYGSLRTTAPTAGGSWSYTYITSSPVGELKLAGYA